MVIVAQAQPGTQPGAASGFDLGNSLESIVASAAAFLPKLLGFLIILVLGYLLAKLVSKAVNALLERVGFDRVVERGGVKKALARSKFDASDILAKIAFWAVFLFVLQAAFSVFGPNPISTMIFAVISYLPLLFVAILIVVVASAIAAAVREIASASLGGLSYGNILANGASAIILAVGVFAALSQLRIAPAILNAVFYAMLAIIAGSAIVAIGGGGIQPMREQWEKALNRMEQEAPQIRQEAEGSSEDIRLRYEERADQVRTASAEDTSGTRPRTGATRRR
jgi:hypothetical protein